MNRLAGCVAVGLVTHVALYDLTHSPGFPELGRYGIGIVMIAGCVWIVTRDERLVLEILGVATLAGAGVALGRVVRSLSEARTA